MGILASLHGMPPQRTNCLPLEMVKKYIQIGYFHSKNQDNVNSWSDISTPNCIFKEALFSSRYILIVIIFFQF